MPFHNRQQKRDERDDKRWERWFWENTYHNSRFSDIDELIEKKKERDLSISVGIPTLNEEDTIGDILEEVKKPLQNEKPLVDQIAVIDSDSTDNTREIARDMGVEVFNSTNYRDQTGFIKGKGVNLWLSLNLLDGDVICWVDADIENFHPKFIYGLVGPVLRQDDIEFVKAFYERPIKVSGELKPTGGGRVTELLARPVFNIFFPELSYFVQPLSGEYAGLRSILESIPFFPGYGVETGMLIDLTHHYGLHKIAQVNLDTRVHHNQPLSGLRKMAFRILQVVLLRAQERGRLPVNIDETEVMNLIGQQGKDLFLEKFQSKIEEQPPMKELPSYQRRREEVEQRRKEEQDETDSADEESAKQDTGEEQREDSKVGDK